MKSFTTGLTVRFFSMIMAIGHGRLQKTLGWHPGVARGRLRPVVMIQSRAIGGFVAVDNT